MSYEVYKIIHLTGIVLLFSGLVGLLALKMSGAALEGKTKKFIFLTHGIGAFFVLLGGFGLLARLELARSIPNWAYAKILIWLVLGGSVALIKRKGQFAFPIYVLLMILFIAAACLAIFKPF